MSLGLVAYRRRRLPEDPFFDEGNYERCLSYRRLMPGGLIEDPEEFAESLRQTVSCYIDSCPQKFSSISQLEAHFHHSHSHQCGTCRRSYTTERLLGLHISENHDSYFSVASATRPMFECIVDGCLSRFMTKSDRHTHLVEVHKYPTFFDFDKPKQIRTKHVASATGIDAKTKTTKAKGAKPSGGTHRGAVTAAAARASLGDTNALDTDTAAAINMAVDDISCDTGHSGDGAQESKPLKRVNRPCIHYAKGYCRMGDTCAFLHRATAKSSSSSSSSSSAANIPSSAPAPVAAGASVTMEVDPVAELSADFQKSVRVSVPAQVRFGRRRVGFETRKPRQSKDAIETEVME